MDSLNVSIRRAHGSLLSPQKALILWLPSQPHCDRRIWARVCLEPREDVQVDVWLPNLLGMWRLTERMVCAHCGRFLAAFSRLSIAQLAPLMTI